MDKAATDSRKQRLDILLMERGLAESKNKAQAMILAGQVRLRQFRVKSLELSDSQLRAKPPVGTTHNSQPLKPGTLVPQNFEIEVESLPRFVSRGGEKLQSALDHWKLSVKNKICLDIGSSTGGFTDCLLQNHASRVYAVDVGQGQLHPKLRNDPRVCVYEKMHILNWQPPWEDEASTPSFATIDVSFISLRSVLQRIVAAGLPFDNLRTSLSRNKANSNSSATNATDREGQDEGKILALLKPQFEVGAKYIRKGIVRDAKVRQQTIEKMLDFCDSIQLKVKDHFPCPILGMKGNQEEWLYL